jgi:phosphoglycolate phosphatase-like HAD superfamily hydrolase
MTIIFDYNRTLFDPNTDALYPGVKDMLYEIKNKHQLFLVSRLEASRQNKLEQLGIASYFVQTYFTPEKTEALFSSIPTNSLPVLVVGDSIADEITIGNRLGHITVQVQQGLFANAKPKNDMEKATHTIKNITEIVSIISQYE